MQDMTLEHIAAGDTVTFRCGGTATVGRVKEGKDENFPIEVHIFGYHCHGDDGWSYDKTGVHGQGTGPDGEAPFDILRYDREAATVHLKPVYD